MDALRQAMMRARVTPRKPHLHIVESASPHPSTSVHIYQPYQQIVSYALKYEWVQRGPTPAIARIKQAVCERYGISEAELIGHRRHKYLGHARQVAMYLCAKLTTHALTNIARHFGNRDHSTVIHGRDKIARLREQDPKLARELVNFEQQLGG